MEAFKILLEVSTHILKLSRDNNFSFTEIYRVPQTTDGRIEFSLLFDIKQSASISGKYITVELVHILDTFSQKEQNQNTAEKQRIRIMELGQIDLSDSNDAADKDKPTARLVNDPWASKHFVKWNCSSVPTDGSGPYAIVTSIPSEENPDKKSILDCSYFEVI